MAKTKFDVAQDISTGNLEEKKEPQKQETETTPEAIEKLLKQSQEMLNRLAAEEERRAEKERKKAEKSMQQFSLFLNKEESRYIRWFKFEHNTTFNQIFNELVKSKMENDTEWKKTKE